MRRKNTREKESQGRPKKDQRNLSQNSSVKRRNPYPRNIGSSDENKRKKRRGPSEEALQLSAQLKKLSREKKLDEALSLFWESSNDRIRDGHHACIMVDIAARCGSISQGEVLLERVAKEGIFISVETKTALLKGICHAGKIGKAQELFNSMCDSKAKSNFPNVRTLNTLLRGCLWSAATLSDNDKMVGGVITAESAWKRYKSLKIADKTFDISSYEYSVTLLCQALRVDDAIARISEMKLAFDVSEHQKDFLSSDDQSLAEGLAVVYCALARAYTVMKKREAAISACKSSLHFAQVSKDALKSNTSFSRKRGWRVDEKDNADRRTESNSIYRNHRLSEIEAESTTLMNVWRDVDIAEVDSKVLSRELARRLITRLVFLSGGGTTGMRNETSACTNQNAGEKKDVAKEVQRSLLNSLYFSYGLATAVKALGISINEDIEQLRKKDCNKILGGVGLQGGILKADGSLDIHRIFSAGIGISKPQKKRKSKRRQVEVELGAGFGDWIVRKAIQDPSTDFLAVELRADRVAQIFARTAVLSTIEPINNLCIVGAESGNLLCNHLSNDSVDKIYVNHPEPPTQTFGAGTNLLSIKNGCQEPAHMLNSDVIVAAGKALKKVSSSRFVVVTDNFWYGRLICATIEKVMRENTGLFHAIDLTKLENSHSFTKVDISDDGSESSVLMFEGKPNEIIGYPSGSGKEGESYFDRLWRAGAGRHAEMHTRYIIVLSPCQ